MRARIVSFCVAVILVLFGPTMLACVDRLMHEEIPEWLTNKEVTYLIGNNTQISLRSVATLEGFKSRELQLALENTVGRNIPLKAEALLGNAALQRSTIALSNGLFNWDCYPTYYGSGVVFVPSSRFLTSTPATNSEQNRAALKAFGDELALFANNHPEVSFCVVVPDCSQISTVLPSAKMVRNQLDEDSIAETMTAEWQGTTNVSLSITTSDDYTQFIQHHYHTDGHWNGYGALYAYEKLRSSLSELSKIETIGEYEGPVFNGQNSRLGLMLLEKHVQEPLLDTSAFEVESGTSGWILSEDPQASIDSAPSEAEYNFYARWYGADADNVIVNNRGGEGSVLLVSDSYGDAFRWIISQSFYKTFDFIDLHSSSKGEVSLNERLEETDSKIVVFVGIPSDYCTFLKRHPNYFQ